MINSRARTPNSKMLPVDVAGSSTFGRYERISPAKTYNMFLSDNWLINFPGYKKVSELLDTTVGAGRGIFYSAKGDFLLVVARSRVFRLDSSLFPTLIGTLNTSQGEVFIDENLNSQICIVDGSYAYIYYYLSGPNLTVQTAGALSGSLTPNYVTYHNTYFLFGNSASSQWYAYSFDTNTTIQQTTELALQTKPDNALAVIRLPGQGNNVLVLGRIAGEIWTQVGGNQNYRRNSTINLDMGCASVSTIAANDIYVVWLGINEDNERSIMAYSPQGLRELDTDGIGFELSRINEVSKSTGMMYRQDGHLFYHLTFYGDSDNLTIIYDFNTSKFFHLSDGFLNYHPARQVAFFNNKQYFVSLNNTNVYEQSTNYTTYNENLSTDPTEWDDDINYEIQRIRICSNVFSEDSGFFRVNLFSFILEQGSDGDYINTFPPINIITEDTEEVIVSETENPMVTENSPEQLIYRPRVDLSFSKDGGITWSNTLGRQLNRLGLRRSLLKWECLGSANTFTIKLRFWQTNRVVANNGFIEVF